MIVAIKNTMNNLNSLPKNASSLKFSKFNSNVMGLCLTMHVNLGMSLRKT